MTDLRLYKVRLEIDCTEHDDDGDVVGEQTVAKGAFFAKQLDELPELIHAAVDEARRTRE